MLIQPMKWIILKVYSCLTLDTSRIREKVGSQKVISIDTGNYTTVGEPWKVCAVVNYFKGLLKKLIMKLNQRKLRIADYTIASLLLAVSIGVCIMSLAEIYDSVKLIYSTILTIIYLASSIIMTSSLLYFDIYSCFSEEISLDLSTCISSGRIINSIICLFCGIVLCDELLWQGITVTVIGFLSSGVYFIIILISMLSTPFLIIGIMCEFIIRVALCKLACPDKVMIKNNFHYQIFRHKNSSSNDTECVVCLDNFNDGDEIVMWLAG